MKVLNLIFIFIIACIFPIFKFYTENFTTNLIGDGLDNLLVLTILERNIINIYNFFTHLSILNIYSSNAFYPYQYTALFTEPMYFPSIIYGIVKYITGNQTTSYNSLFIVASVFNFYSFLILCKQLKFKKENSIIGSIFYANGHYFAIQYVHLQNQFAFGFPLILAFVINYKRTKKKIKLFYIFVVLLLQFFSSNYYGLFLFYFFILSVIVIYFIQQKQITFQTILDFIKSKSTLRLTIPAFLFVFTIIGLYFYFFKENLDLYPKRIIEENIVYSNSILSFITLPANISNFPFLNLIGTTHTSSHFGYFFIITLILILTQMSSLNKYQLIFLISAILFYFLSLGPLLKIFNLNIPGPYSIFYYLIPGFKSIRVPSRIFIVSWFFFALVFASSKNILSLQLNRRTITVLYSFILLELSFFTKISETSILPNQANLLLKYANQPNMNVLFLNYKEDKLTFETSSFPEYYFLGTQVRTPNGYSGITFPFQYYIINLLIHYQTNPNFYNYLYQLGISHIGIIDKNYDSNTAKKNENPIYSFKNLKPIFNDIPNHLSFYQINPSFPENVSQEENKNPSKIGFKISDSSFTKKIENLYDNNNKTYWKSFSSGYQSPKDYLVFLLDRVPKKNLLIRLHSGPYVERLPYGVNISCLNKNFDYDLIPIEIKSFLKNPVYDSYQDVVIQNCSSNKIEIRVKHKTPYSILMLSEIELFELSN